MMRTVKSHHEEVEDGDEDFASTTPDCSSQTLKVEGKSSNQKPNANRSKHSETEQRRRSKINERFQILRDLIPENDQKRDKASFLLEVIQYIQFLQEKLQVYEGSYQSWSPELSKLMPWRSNSGPGECFAEQSQLVRNASGHEDNIVVSPTSLNAQNLVESDLSHAATYKATDCLNGAGNEFISLDTSLQPNIFDGVSVQPPKRTFPDAEHLASLSQSQYWPGKSSASDCAIPSCTPDEEEGLKSESEEASISNSCSQGLLNALTRALRSSGVDLSQASISVQLDICKQTNCGSSITTIDRKDHGNPPATQTMGGYMTNSENYDQAHKRLRADQG